MTLMADRSFSPLWGSSDVQPFERQEVCQWRQKKRSLPDSASMEEHQECLSKRFASEEQVTANLRDLHISTPHTPHLPHTHPHPLMVTAITDCPAHGFNEHYITTNCGSVSNDEQYLWQQSLTNQNWYNSELLMRGFSSATLLNDPSLVDSWQRGGDACPPMYPIQAEPRGEEPWMGEARVLPPVLLAANQMPPDIEDTMMVEKEQETSTVQSVFGGKSPSSSSKHLRRKKAVSPPWSCWRQPTLDEVSSDSSDGGNDGPERPLSVWIAPEILQCAQRVDQGLPQSLLEKYNKPTGMEVVLWVDPNERLKNGCVETKGAVTGACQDDVDMC